MIGAEEPGTTVIAIVSEAVKFPSLTWKIIFEKVPTCEALGIHENIPVLAANEAPGGKLDTKYVKASLFGSVADTINWRSLPAFANLFPIGFNSGVPLAVVTVIVIVSASVKEPSDTWKVMFGNVPDWLEAGVQEKV